MDGPVSGGAPEDEVLEMPRCAMMYIINHVVLPPQLPQKDDYKLEDVSWLLHHALVAMNLLRAVWESEETTLTAPVEIQTALDMLDHLSSICGYGQKTDSLNEEKLQDSIKQLNTRGAPIPVYLRAQNAGVIVSPATSADAVQFELFEVSPLNKAAMSTVGRLRRVFPGCAIVVPNEEINKAGFLPTLSKTLAKMANQSAYSTLPEVTKAGQKHQEDRDTHHPKVVTELLAAYLRSMGTTVEVSSIVKYTRQDVLWHDARSPWHRSALWLLIRVTLQLFFSRREPPFVAKDIYKNYMLLFLGYILQQARKYQISSDLIWSIKAKITRRRLKLGVTGNPGVLRFVDNALLVAENDLKLRWSHIQSRNSLNHSFTNLQDLSVAEDTLMHLQSLDKYLAAVANRAPCPQSAETPHKFSLPDPVSPLDCFINAVPNSTPKIFELLKLEYWIESNLDTWFTKNLDDMAYKKLKVVLESYYAMALTEYRGNPEAVSNMILTMLHLWVVLDKSAIRDCSLLADYAPCIPVDPLRKLLLPEKNQMERLSSIEQYLTDRARLAKFTQDDIFRLYGGKDSFAVQYFNKSKPHHDLLLSIEQRANDSKNSKLEELKTKRSTYRRHAELYEVSTCEYTETRNPHTDILESTHKTPCNKCDHRTKMNSLQIELHEWPLPQDKNQAKTIVFELFVPRAFGYWRDSTIFMLINVLGFSYRSECTPNKTYHPEGSEVLRDSFIPYGEDRRVRLVSKIKPHARTHRFIKLVGSTTAAEVCVQNGMSLSYYDTKKACYVDVIESTNYLTKCCMFRLSKASEYLQQFLDGTVSPITFSNAIIARQFLCPQLSSLEEYKGTASLRAGNKVRWHNLLKELASPSVDFTKVDTVLILLQCIQQAGRADAESILRETHKIIDDERFCVALLDNLLSACGRFSRNWRSAPMASAFVSIANRVLSLSSNLHIQKLSLEVLSTIRRITMDWIETLKQKAEEATEDHIRADFISRSVFAAFICADSFNVSRQVLRSILSNPDQAAILIRCNIVIHEGGAWFKIDPPLLSSLLRYRWKRLCLHSLTILSEEIVSKGNNGLDEAIKYTWAGYQPIGQWHPQQSPYTYWLSSGSRLNIRNHFVVEYSLLTGELLVNGAPFNKLPENYQKNPTYQRLFGNLALEVMPCSRSSMRFSGKQRFAGYLVDFDLGTEQKTLPENCLLVRASNEESTLELIPPCLLEGKLPIAFVEEYIHWYHVLHDYVEFRPLHRMWSYSDKNWQLRRAVNTNAWVLSKADKSLVRSQSTTASRFYKIFKTLEDPPYIHVTLDNMTSTLQIDLPRIQLEFSTLPGIPSIRSHQHRGMVIHEDQNIGALVGLKSKLVLKSTLREFRNKVILPNGKVTYQRDVNTPHVCVTIEKSSSTKTLAYDIDTQLGRVIDNGTLTSKLTLAYLHGVTAFCLPDPLTGLTGTDAALTILRSAGLRSFPSAKQGDLDLLLAIAHLTPGREYYPPDLQNMETVRWSSKLGFLAQHSQYYEQVENLVPDPPKIDETLSRREKVRSAFVRTWGFGAEDHSIIYDRDYSPRDRSQNSPEALSALSLSTIVFKEEANPQVQMPEDIGGQLWDFLEKYEVIRTGPPSSSDQFGFEGTLLLDSFNGLRKDLLCRIAALRSADHRLDKYRVMVWLATLSFAPTIDMTVLQVAASMYVERRMKIVELPKATYFELHHGWQLLRSAVSNTVLSWGFNLGNAPNLNIERLPGEGNKSYRTRRKQVLWQGIDRTTRDFTDKIMSQWPCEVPSKPPDSESWESYINVDLAMVSLISLFLNLNKNIKLRDYLHRLGNETPRGWMKMHTLLILPRVQLSTSYRNKGFLSDDDVFSGQAPVKPTHTTPDIQIAEVRSQRREKASLLPLLLEKLHSKARSPFEFQYVEGLRTSMSALHGRPEGHGIEFSYDDLRSEFVEYRETCQRIVNKGYSAMESAIIRTIRERLCDSKKIMRLDLPMQHFPQPCHLFFLKRLSRKNWSHLPEDWKRYLIYYGIAITQLQRVDRLIEAIGNPAFLFQELENTGHKNWNPYHFPESLLMEIENGILIREVQEQIATQMRSPPDECNAVMQLNMGEGKSSVIVPVVAAALADGSQLVRMIVAKPQSKQMLQMLIAKLGGLVDRQIYHLPVSRACKIDNETILTIGSLIKECVETGGILLTQPENILSFMLMGIESCIYGNRTISQWLIKILQFLDMRSRDIVDESDENLADVLGIFKDILSDVQRQFPLSIEIHPGSNGGFPRVRLLRADAEEFVIKRTAESICCTGIREFPIIRQPEGFRRAVFEYITETQPCLATISTVENDDPAGFWANWRNTLLLLRGLFAGGILNFCFRRKRWRVNYGLDPSRKPGTKLAVPFKAKDFPTPRSEFSHPEVVVVLTQLSYYYRGLSCGEMCTAFKHLLNSDQADMEFQTWVRGVTGIPEEFRQLDGVNLEDRSTFEEEIYPQLRFSQNAINYFLSKIVFPKEMKEYPLKLAASGWDIGKTKKHPTTGFSGTNDSRAVLPLTVSQLDLDQQRHTNALVLENLLQPENKVAVLPSSSSQEKSDAQVLLDMVIEMNPPVRVILDVGAQILELDNMGVARQWLSCIQDTERTQAAVFFDSNDELSVLNRQGHVELLQVSPFIDQLDFCLVFLDEAHTRGTELKLPRNYRAAVTLGTNLTKDRLVQACMRMRLLGEGQSVVFCVPQEILSAIQQGSSYVQCATGPNISVADILSWAITETWDDTRRSMPLWAAQGRRQKKHNSLWALSRASRDGLTKDLAERFLEDEAKTLEDRYRPQEKHVDDYHTEDEISLHCRQFNNLDSERLMVALEEEQERELAPEIQQEKQDERPPFAEAEKHEIHPDVLRFIETGKIVAGCKGYMPAFDSLQLISASSLFDAHQLNSPLLVSADFVRVVKPTTSIDTLDRYQRAIQWILTASEDPRGDVRQMMIISPYEANELLSDIQKSTHVALHLYAAQPNLGYRPLDKLDLYTIPEANKDRAIPRRFITALNLFAGQLYVSSFDEYVDICEFLGLAWEPAKDGEVIGADGFIYSDHAGRVGGKSGLSASPVEFFKVFLTKVRRDCETIEKTHLGRILDNQLLSPNEFE
ncbi:hypothetical protein F5Y08DRAFT_353840 [Xylaria arbuscula]|nr:hypothetical protein F5Y08DRAFT_353840 [Xylaria arbuscula]